MTPTYEQAQEWFTPEREKRFWAKIDKMPEPFGCWLWRGAPTDTGHGQYRMLGGVVRVHRLMWIWVRQRDIPDWLVVRHLMCNNHACCNPSHLVGGTQGENVEDKALHSAYDMAKEELATLEFRVHPYVGFFSEKTICNPPLVDSGQSSRLHMINTGGNQRLYPLPAIA
jgi:hypothetical protein